MCDCLFETLEMDERFLGRSGMVKLRVWEARDVFVEENRCMIPGKEWNGCRTRLFGAFPSASCGIRAPILLDVPCIAVFALPFRRRCTRSRLRGIHSKKNKNLPKSEQALQSR